MRKTGNMFIAIAVVFALAAGFLAMQALNLALPTVPVLIATKDLAPGDVLNESILNVVKVPQSVVGSDRITGANVNQTLGKHIQTYIAAGDPIRQAHISEWKNGGTVAAKLSLIDKSLRAIALPPDATKGLKVEEGDKVDVIGIMDVQVGSGRATQSVFLAGGVPVVDSTIKSESNSEASITVGLTPEQALNVAYAMKKGQVLAALVPIEPTAPMPATPVTEGADQAGQQ
jgi:Flp pilus assembly protein CpaB